MATEQGRVAECHNKTEHNGEHSKEDERKKIETKFAEPACSSGSSIYYILRDTINILVFLGEKKIHGMGILFPKGAIAAFMRQITVF